MKHNGQQRFGRAPEPADLVPGARLRMVNSLHAGMTVEVKRVTVTSVQFEYVATAAGKRAKAHKVISQPRDWIVSHTEVV